MIWTLIKIMGLALLAFLIFGEVKHVEQMERLMKHGLPKVRIILKSRKGRSKKP